MYELVFIVALAALAYHSATTHDDEFAGISRKVGDRMGKLWDIAHHSMRQQRFLRAEKALLIILKIDEKNVAAYNRLGILYAKQKEFKDAIDCFEIASSIEATSSSLHNLGLIYYETENYEKASIAFEQAIKLEENLAARHIAYAKVQEKLGNVKMMIQELEKAVELEPSKEAYTLLYRAYMNNSMEEEASKLKGKIKKLPNKASVKNKLTRPRRVIV